MTKYKVTYTKAKDRKNRTAPISKELYDYLPDDRKSLLFSDCYGAFRSALERTGIELPVDSDHMFCGIRLRSTMMRGKGIFVLQRILGHTDIKVTMQYAHFVRPSCRWL
ncbi:tyrosine-type recombinase/integrase [Pectobacterium carotovorum subsp. carotovorum]|nr:tyrosine-type recombinase/integrase [Pectobacterium carotovorum subsp. carotovorum]